MSSLALRSTIAGLTLAALAACYVQSGPPPASSTTNTTSTTASTATSAPEPVPSPAAQATSTPAAQAAAAATSGVRITIGDTIRQACGLSGDTSSAPRFEHRSASLVDTGAQNDVARTADCVKNGALKGAMIRVVGRTNESGDPRADADLAMKRADATKAYLTRLGIPPENVTTVAQPSVAAGGTDRAVEVQLAVNPRFKR